MLTAIPSFRNQLATRVPMDKIAILDLTGNCFGTAVPHNLHVFPNLTILILDHNNISRLERSDDRGNAIFSPMPKLHTLWLNNNNITSARDIGEDILELYPRLKYLSMINNPVCDITLVNKDEKSYWKKFENLSAVLHTFLSELERLNMRSFSPQVGRFKTNLGGLNLMEPGTHHGDGSQVQMLSFKNVLSVVPGMNAYMLDTEKAKLLELSVELEARYKERMETFRAAYAGDKREQEIQKHTWNQAHLTRHELFNEKHDFRAKRMARGFTDVVVTIVSQHSNSCALLNAFKMTYKKELATYTRRFGIGEGTLSLLDLFNGVCDTNYFDGGDEVGTEDLWCDRLAELREEAPGFFDAHPDLKEQEEQTPHPLVEVCMLPP